ncbi:MAG TPA: twin-arginine translocase subunit TatC [Polyangia bacterium]|jgi:sec-independent protein translocase protein TatC
MAEAPAAASAPGAPAPDEEAGEKRMPFLAHLDELRTCMRNSAIAILGGTVVAYLFRQYLFALMARPLIDAWAQAEREVNIGRPEMVFTSPVDAFMVLFKLALLVGVFIASPFVFREVWRFISPGLYERERKWGVGFVFASVLLFVGGAMFAYIYVLPASYKYFLGYSTEALGVIKNVMGKAVDVHLSLPFDIKPMITMDEYFSLTSMLLLVFGLVFELPLLLSILAILGIVSAGQLWRFNRFAVVIFAVLGAVLTPGDLVVGQLAMTASLTVLYNLSILIAVIVGKKRKEREAAEEAAYLEEQEPPPPATS